MRILVRLGGTSLVLGMVVLVLVMRASPKCVSWWLGGLVGR